MASVSSPSICRTALRCLLQRFLQCHALATASLFSRCVPLRRREFEAYMVINRYFAEALLKIIEDGDVIWIHDYHLIPLGSLLREAKVNARDRILSAHPLSEHRGAAAAADLRRAGAGLVPVRSGGISNSEKTWRVSVPRCRPCFPTARIANSRYDLNGRNIGIGVFPIGVDVDEIARQARRLVPTMSRSRAWCRGCSAAS